MWLTIKWDPKEETINVNEFMKVKEELNKIAREVYDNTQTDVLIERAVSQQPRSYGPGQS